MVDLQSDLDIGAREEFACFIGHFQFSQQSFGGPVDLPSRPYNPSRKFSSCNSSPRKVGLGTSFHKFHSRFGHTAVHTQPRKPVHPEKLGATAHGPLTPHRA